MKKLTHIRGRFIRFLRWSEKYTKTDMVHLAGGGFWLLFAQVVASIAALTVTVLLINLLSKETFGQYRFILSVISILAIFTLPGIGTALTRAVARGARVDLRTIAKVKIKWGLLGSLASLLIALYYFINQGNELLVYTFVLSAIFLPFFETFFIYSFYYKGLQNFKTPAIYESISRMLQAVLMIAAVLITKSILALIAAFFVGQLATRLFFYLRTLKTLKLSVRESRFAVENIAEEKNDTVEYGKWLSLVTFMSIIAVNIDKIFVWHTLGAAALAIYVVILIIPTQIAQTFGLVNQLLLPRFSKKHWTDYRMQLFIKRLSVVAIVLILFTVFITPIIALMFPYIFQQYKTYAALLYIVLPILVLLPIRDGLFYFLIAQKKHQAIMVILTISLLLYASLFVLTNASIKQALFLLLIKEACSVFMATIYVVYNIRKNTEPAPTTQI